MKQKSPSSTAKSRARSIYKSTFDYFIRPAHRSAEIDYYKSPTIRKELGATIKGISSPQPRGVILCGPVGSGKTSALSILFSAVLDHSADAVYQIFSNKKEGAEDPDFDWEYARARVRPELAYPYSYSNHAELIKRLRESSGKKEDWWDQQFIFIDDYGTGYSDNKGWNLYLEQLFFDYRWSHGLPVYVSTNYGVEELRALRRGEKGVELQRIIDRMCDARVNSTIVLLGESGRKKNNDQ